MNKRWVKIVAWVALAAFGVLCLASLLPFGAYAQSAQQRIDRAEQRQRELQAQIDESKKKQSAEMQKKSVIDDEVAQVQAEIDALDAQLAQSDEKIAGKEAELAVAQEASNAQNLAYQNRVKMMVERGAMSYLEILLGADSFSDFLVRADIIRQVADYDNKLLDTLKEKEQAIADIKQELEAERAVTADARSQVDARRQVLNVKIAESQKIIDDLKKDQSKLKAQQEQAARDEQAARNEIAAALGRSGNKGSFSGGQFLWPSPVTTRVSSEYSMRTHPTLGVYKQHTGIDIPASYGTDVLAGDSGTVLIAGWNNAYGYMVVIDHGGGVTTLYGHNSKLLVSAGQSVSRGQVIARVGSTGYSTGPHIHFEVSVNGQHVNPNPYLGR